MSNQTSTKKLDPLREEGVVLPGATPRPIPGISYRPNDDGTFTYFPSTCVAFCSSGDVEHLRENLTPEEVALVESVVLNREELIHQVSYDHIQRWPTLTPLSHEQARKSALTKLYSDVANDEFLFVATRSLREDEIVGAIRLNLNTKNASVCVAESMPASISVQISATIDLCRGKSPLALRQMLAKVQHFFVQWAAFRQVADRAKHASRTAYVSCDYELRINMVEDDQDWIYPTKTMLEEWGYNPKGIQCYGQQVDESKLVICRV